MAVSITLAGKVALVTGGGRGIGKAITERLVEAGADVAIASRKLDVLEATAAEIAAQGGAERGRVLPIECHVGRAEDIDTSL